MQSMNETSRDIVRRALKHDDPDRVPVYMFNRDLEMGDIVAADLITFPRPETGLADEWGQLWHRLDNTMGQPDAPVVHSVEEIESLVAPPTDADARRRVVAARRETYPDKYLMASLALTGFNRAAFLRGFDNALMDMAESPAAFSHLLDTVCGFEESIIQSVADCGADAIALFDDWGMQDALLTSRAMFLDLVLPRYKRQFDMVHELGMDVYFHSCGRIDSIVADLVNAGVDLINISQPNCNDLAAIGESLRGHTTFVVPISYQTTSISGTPDDIHAEAKRMYDLLAGPHGGFSGYVEDYAVMGMSEENYQACIEAFRSLETGRTTRERA